MDVEGIRPATEADLPEIHALWYATEVEEAAHPPDIGAVVPNLAHVLASGDMLVAERTGDAGDIGRIAGFAGLITRGDVAFLTDLFVRPDTQSAGVGSALLERILPRDARVLATSASGDLRAVALYIRAGMRPRWPDFWLRGASARLRSLQETGVAVVAADPADTTLLEWDAAIAGRPRSQDLAYYVRECAAVPLWFERDGRRVGYGYIQRRSPESLWFPTAYTLGPIGAHTPLDAAACVLAAVGWARTRAEVVRVPVPGPHPALPPLLAAGFHIADQETFLTSAEEPFADVQRYLPSGTTLF
jgi:GNAT superfamily N-acetyltransferase